jgi:hypothetical protein
MGGKSGGSGNTTSLPYSENKQAPAYVQAAGQNLVGSSQDVTQGFLQPSDYAVAGFNPDQLAAFELTRQAAYNGLNSPYPDFVNQFKNAGAQAYTTTAAQSPAASTYTATTAGPAAQATAHTFNDIERAVAKTVGKENVERAIATLAAKEQLKPGEILPFMSPYIQGVIDPTINNMRANAARTAADIGAKTAAAGSFAGSGSRGALMQAQNNRALGEQVSTTAANLMNQGYSQASALAMANAQMRNQVEMLNANLGTDVSKFNAHEGNQVAMFDVGQENDISKFNAGQGNTVGMFNAGQQNQVGMFNTGQTNSQNQFNATAQNQAGQFNAGQQNQVNMYNTGQQNQVGMYNTGQQNSLGLNLLNAQQSAESADQQRRLQMIAALLGIGNQQQTFQQSALDVPEEYLKLLGATTPQDTSSNTTGVKSQLDTSPSPAQQILGGALTLGSAALKSDRNSKTNIEPLGVDERTGLMMYAYDYITDVEAAKAAGTPMGPKRVGPMAQEVEAAFPGTTRRIGGTLVIETA